jgi:hypothetical protein
LDFSAQDIHDMHQQPLLLQEASPRHLNEYLYKFSQSDNYIAQQGFDMLEMHRLIESDQFFSLLLRLAKQQKHQNRKSVFFHLLDLPVLR